MRPCDAISLLIWSLVLVAAIGVVAAGLGFVAFTFGGSTIEI